MTSYQNYRISLLVKKQRDGLGWIARAIIFEEPGDTAVKAIEDTGPTLLVREKDAQQKALQLAKVWIDQYLRDHTANKGPERLSALNANCPDASMVGEMHTLAGTLFQPAEDKESKS